MTETTPEKIGATDVSISTTEKAKTHQWWFQLNRKALEEYAGGLDESVLVDSVLVPVPVPDIDTFTDELNKIISSSSITISNHKRTVELDPIIKSGENLGSKQKILDTIIEILKTLVKKLPPTFQIEDYTDALGKWLFEVFSKYKNTAYGARSLGKFARRTYVEIKELWEMKNDDGFASAFGTLISYMKIQDSEQSSDDSVNPEKAHSWICNFHSGVNAKNVSDDSESGGDSTQIAPIAPTTPPDDNTVNLVDITVGTVYSVFNIQIAKIMNLILNEHITFKPRPPSQPKEDFGIKSLFSPQKKTDSTSYEQGKLLVTKFINKKYFTVDDLDHFWNFVNECENEKISNILPKILDCLCYIGNYENNIPRIVKKIFENQTNEKKQDCIEILYVFLCNKYENDKPRLSTIISEIDFQFVELLGKDNLKTTRECFNIFVPEINTVLRGRFALCQVEPINFDMKLNNTDDEEKVKVYKLSKIADGFKGDETVGDFIFLKKYVFEKPQWISSQEEKEESIQEIVSKRKCVRIASWNVACMNNLDKPTTSDELKTKVNNISEIIIKSGCDVVALQELPFELHIKEDIEKEIIAFDKEKVGFKDQLLLKLNTQTNSNWDIQWTTSFYDDAKKSEGQGVLAFVYNKDIVTLQNPENTGLKIIDQREKSERTKRMPCIASFKVGKLEFILCNVHISPKNAHSEIEELGNDLLPTIQSHYGYLRSKSVIFLGDFNMSIVSKGAFAKPKPKESTWSAFQTGKFNPCIRDCFTNVIQTMLYDNIWIHESMDNIRHISKKLLGMQEKGVFEIKGYIDNENNTKMFLRSDYKDLQKKASDHNLVFIDLKVNKAMQWSEDIVIKGKMISMWDSP